MCQALTYWSDSLGRGECIKTTLLYEITGAKTVLGHDGNAALVSFDAIGAQATIDNFLGTTNEFLIAQFDGTALGTDAVGFIINFGGQVAKLESVHVTVRSSTGLATETYATSWAAATLTSSSLTNQWAAGANGNVAGRHIVSGLDSLTAGQIQLEIFWRSK